MQQIQTAILDNNNLLLISFMQKWDQDDINLLSQCVFKLLPDFQLKEYIQGADREYFRFTFNGEYLVLQFESYSESCWIEPEDQIDSRALTLIHKLLGMS
ncbi:DUF3630 family protein [Thalassotalea psychrophila]|uniref:DUF3630 family protein n=1 Tax=Thalassotalea psychrophila TaxID=3065647 RepID=A0ABY9TUV9_9GAMM|nr:DUF3630 family protein [Colwelliaceae bacterium SQ149]